MKGTNMSKKEIMALCDWFLENQGQASKRTRNAYSKMRTCFDEYLCAVEEDLFQQAFRFGYQKGMEAAKEKEAA